MGDVGDIDLYADDIDPDFAEDEFVNENVDLYDDVVAAPTGAHDIPPAEGSAPVIQGGIHHAPEDTNGNAAHHAGNSIGMSHSRKHQLYIGNLTWWTTDQDIAAAVQEIGVKDFADVKFFENRANGLSKGFCMISLGSEPSMRLCMDRLPKKELHGQNPIVTLATKIALNQFESQSKTRPTPSSNAGPKGPHPGASPQQQHMQSGPMGPPHMMHQQRPMGPPGMGPQGPPMRMQGQNYLLTTYYKYNYIFHIVHIDCNY